MGGVVLEAATLTRAPRPVAGRSDHQLVSLVRAGDDRAFEELFHRYRRRITAYVYGMVADHGRAEDIAQEVFVSALRRMRDTERPIAFRPWIYEIAKNACIDAHRRRSRAEEVSLTNDEGQASGDHLHLVSSIPAPHEAVEVKQRLGNLCGAFGGLSEAHHEILVLRELEGLSYREIGERMGLSRPAVESTLFRARRRLAQEYDELASGARCQRVQAIISSAVGGQLAPRERRRMARHVVHCESCRRHARSLGVATQPTQASGARKLAGLLPLPLLPAAEPLAVGWGKTAATLATLAVAGFSAGAVAQHGGVTPPWRDHDPAAVRQLAADISRAALAAPAGMRAAHVRLPRSSSSPQAHAGTRAVGHDHGSAPARRRHRRQRQASSGGASGVAGARQGGGGGGGASNASAGAKAAPAGGEQHASSQPSGSTAPQASSAPASAPSTPSVSVPSAPEAPDVQTPSAPQVQVPQVQVPQVPDVHVDTPDLPDTSGVSDAVPSVPSLP
jgi:RNA polymerase sigma factor (sigma-70 family)